MLKKLFINLQNRWYFSRLQATAKTRNELRHQQFVVNGKLMAAYQYINLVAARLPKMYRNGEPVRHADLLNRYYYRFDLPGIKYYLRMIHRVEQNSNAKRLPEASSGNK